MPECIVAGISAYLIGLAKSGISGISILTVPLMAETFGARASVGLVLPILITGDILALVFYRKFARWKYILLILPYAFSGIVIGYFLLGRISDPMLKRCMGGLIISLVGLKTVIGRCDISTVSYRHIIAPFIGILAGISTIMANAAGPLMTIYLLWMDIKKEEFIGTGAWYFFILNCSKVPFLVSLDLITSQSFIFDLKLAPLVVLGSVSGVLLVKKTDQKTFERVVLLLALIAGIKLLLTF